MAERQTGLVHLYCGDGKGKTPAAMGLAMRAAGRGQIGRASWREILYY